MDILADPPSLQPSRRQLIGGLALLSTALAGQALMPRHLDRPSTPKGTRIVLPAQVGEWSVNAQGELIMPDAGASDAIYDQLAGKIYSSLASPDVMVLIGYSAQMEGVRKIHRPEICYSYQGFYIKESEAVQIPVGPHAAIPARRLLCERTNRIEQVIYWTRVANRFPQDLHDLDAADKAERLSGMIPDGVLVRLSTVQPDLVASVQILRRFAALLVQSADPNTSALLVGDIKRAEIFRTS